MVTGLGEFKHQSVRDLAWAIASPPLLSQLAHSCDWPNSHWYRELYAESLPWFNRLDADPAELDALLNQQKDRRLGKYFETLWLYWLRNSPRYEIVENNVQVNIDGQTLGEIDFIVFDNTTKQTIHWEMAVKFYLGVGDTRDMGNWYGPNCRDRLDLKVEHLLHKQSLISKNRRVRRWLKQQNIIIDQCAVILKGRLYYPWQTIEQLYQKSTPLSVLTPLQCSAELLFGCWFNERQCDEIFDDRQRFVPLINQGWMEKISTSGESACLSKNDVYEAVAKKLIRYPLHLLLCNPCHSVDRVFIVDEKWPYKDA